jgi:hypothetical protein
MQVNRLALHMAGVAVIVLRLLAAACNSTQAALNASNNQAQSSAPATNTAARTAATTGYNPHIDPANFVKKIDNPLFPLKPGPKYELQSKTSGGVGHETLTMTHDTKKISGVTTTVIKDVSALDGRLEEKTIDWYAQDKQGNVWYFGEDTATYKKNGKVDSTAGTWMIGVKGAKPGIIMNVDPQITDSHRQEYLKGEPEDMYWVIAKNQTIKVPYGTFLNAVLTMEWTPLEPKVAAEKYYVTRIGIVAERNLSGGLENIKLLNVKHNGS